MLKYLFLFVLLNDGETGRICKNETVYLKSQWIMPTGTYTLTTPCIKKIIIPSGSYADASFRVDQFDTDHIAWFAIENAVGFTTVSDDNHFSFWDALHLPSPVAYIAFFQNLDKYDVNLQNMTLYLKPLIVDDGMETIDLEKKPLLAYLNDLFKRKNVLRLVSNDQIWVSSLCESVGGWPFESMAPPVSGPEENQASGIWILQDSGNSSQVIDTLHAGFFRTSTYSSPIILYHTNIAAGSSCIILAMSKTQLEKYHHVRFSYATGYTDWMKGAQQFSLNGTEKPALLVAISRGGGLGNFANWLLPTVLPDSSKLQIFGGFPDLVDNSSQLEYEFTGEIQNPQYIGGILRTFVLTGGAVTIKLTDQWTIDEKIRSDGIKINLTAEGKSMVVKDDSTQYIFFSEIGRGLIFDFKATFPSSGGDIIIAPFPFDGWSPTIRLDASDPNKREILQGCRISLPNVKTFLELTITER